MVDVNVLPIERGKLRIKDYSFTISHPGKFIQVEAAPRNDPISYKSIKHAAVGTAPVNGHSLVLVNWRALLLPLITEWLSSHLNARIFYGITVRFQNLTS